MIAFGCASCPKLTCGREGCGTEFCYHCKQIWHPNQTCDAARQERAQSLRLRTIRSSSISYSQESGAAGIMYVFIYSGWGGVGREGANEWRSEDNVGVGPHLLLALNRVPYFFSVVYVSRATLDFPCPCLPFHHRSTGIADVCVLLCLFARLCVISGDSNFDLHKYEESTFLTEPSA